MDILASWVLVFVFNQVNPIIIEEIKSEKACIAMGLKLLTNPTLSHGHFTCANKWPKKKGKR